MARCVRLRVHALHQSAHAVADLHARRQAGTIPWTDQLSAGTLKHADEQALAALVNLAAIWPGTPRGGLADPQWGLVACPQQPGLTVMQAQTARFREQGPWCVSPHIIPHFSLHSLAGLLSIALQLNGPNLGVGGVAGREAEVFPVAVALLRAGVPGVWLVWTVGWPDERIGTLALAVTLERQSAADRCDPPLPAPCGELHWRLDPSARPHLTWGEALTQSEWAKPSVWDMPGLGSIAWEPTSRVSASDRSNARHG